jgi:hypothetical protein
MLQDKNLEIHNLKKEMLETKFESWRELQGETNPQYSVQDEVAFLNEECDDEILIQMVFDELYPGQYVYDTKTKMCKEEEE